MCICVYVYVWMLCLDVYLDIGIFVFLIYLYLTQVEWCHSGLNTGVAHNTNYASAQIQNTGPLVEFNETQDCESCYRIHL